jgi:hypothetical protein
MSRSHPVQEKQTDMVRHYLEREFPGQVRNLRWEWRTSMHMFEVVHETTVHRVEMPAAFFEDCPDYAAALRESELADYMREARDQRRRFSVVWENDEVRVRSTPL